jgi:hypothetical protein
MDSGGGVVNSTVIPLYQHPLIGSSNLMYSMLSTFLSHLMAFVATYSIDAYIGATCAMQ